MLIITPATLLAIILPPTIFLIAFALASRSLSDREKSSPFECGFDPYKSARQPFSLRFFLLAVIFLVFDVEIVLLLPVILETQLKLIIVGRTLFLIILILGLLHE